MALQFILGNSGSGKSTFLYNKIIKESMENPNRDYLIIVPEQFTMQTQKELVSLHPRHAIMNIDVLSFNRLAFRVFDELGLNDFIVLEETGKNLVLRKVASEQKSELKVLGGNLQKMGYISEIKSLISELSQYNITPDMLMDLVAQRGEDNSFSYKLSDIHTMYQGFLDYMEGTYITAEEVLELLAKVAGDSKLLADSVMVFDGFTGFTPIQNSLLEVIFPMVQDVIVTGSFDEREDVYRKPEIQELFYMTKKMVQSLMKIAENTKVEVLEPVILKDGDKHRYVKAPAIYHLEQNLFRRSPKTYEKEQDEIKVIELKGPREELLFAAGEIRRLVREENYRYRDFAIVSGNDETYANYAETIFDTYEIPYFLDSKKNILFHPFTEFIRASLEMLERDFSYESVFRYFRTGLSGVEMEQIDLLENYVLATGVRGFKKWNQKWLRLPKNWKEETLEELNEMREKFVENFQAFRDVFLDKEANTREKTVALYQLIKQHKLQEQLVEYQHFFEENHEPAKAKEYEQIYEIVMHLFEKMVELLGEEKLTLKEYGEILDAGFEAASVGVIPPGYDRVLIGDIERTRLEHIKVLFFIGLNDGIIPKADQKGGIISQLERENLAENDIELSPTARERAFIQKFYLYMNMTKPSDKLYLTYGNVSVDGKAIRKSYLISTITKLFPKLTITEEDVEQTLELVTPKSSLQYFLSGLEAAKKGNASPEWEALYAWYMKNEAWAGKVTSLVDAAFYCHGREYISPEITRALYGSVLENSVTRLEKFASCAFAHFLSYGLGLSEREISEFAPLDLGNILHQAMEDYSKALEKSSYTWFDVPEDVMKELTEDALSNAVNGLKNTVLYDSAKDTYMIERMRFLLNRTVNTLTEQVKRGTFIPENYEVSFDFAEDLKATNFALSKEEKMRLKGRIDRMDLWQKQDDVFVKIIDYKSGGSTKFELLSIYHGLQLQLVVYMNAGMELMGKKYPQKEVHPAGIFYYHMDDPIVDVAEETSEEEVWETIIEKLKLDGMVNDADEVIDAMDSEMNGTSSVLPLGRKKDGTLKAGSHAVSEEQFSYISSFVNKKIQNIGTKIMQGDIDASPYSLDKKNACAYCPYSGVCGFDERMPGFDYRKLANIKENADVLDKMRKEVEDERIMDSGTAESH